MQFLGPINTDVWNINIAEYLLHMSIKNSGVTF